MYDGAGLPWSPYFLTLTLMLAKITSKNQLTLPKRVVESLGSPAYLEVEVQDGRLILTPPGVAAADAVRRKLEALGITEADVAEAVTAARRPH
jgi:bifunctional DNA-binding transcriptional regulator/antitoxin component of YhaV-PrlF toxin-antitoxin module